MSDEKTPVALIIIDGFGFRDDQKHNAIANANAPTWSKIWQQNPKTLIDTSGMAVGLPEGQMGNSEVGHMTLGAGRVIYQNFTRINKAIEDGDFFNNSVYKAGLAKAKEKDSAVHIFGLLSPGGVHSHEDHICAMAKMANENGAPRTYVHAFLDGRDTPPRSAEGSLEKLENAVAEYEHAHIASICGRFYAMDRDNRWDRVKLAFDLLAHGQGEHKASSAKDGLKAAYERDENDEFVSPTSILIDGQSVKIEDDDVVIFMNFRPDRARELSQCFVDADFDGFDRQGVPALSDFVTTTEYSADLDANVAFPPEDVVDSFGEVVANHKKTQLRIAETEKYAHVTFFFNGGREETFDGEERILVPSPNVKTYDLQPEMSAEEVTDKLTDAIRSRRFDAIICNYANCDQVGHTGNYEASIKAVESVDACLARVFEAMKEVGGECLVTADHGNVEEMFDEETGQAHTQHTTLPVPLVYVGERSLALRKGGSLADIAPSLLHLMGVEKPELMSGESLIEIK